MTGFPKSERNFSPRPALSCHSKRLARACPPPSGDAVTSARVPAHPPRARRRPCPVARYGNPARPLWLIIRRTPGVDASELAFHLSNAESEPPSEELATVLDAAPQANQYLADAEEFLGLSHYEWRSWISWHHHMDHVVLAHGLATRARIASG